MPTLARITLFPIKAFDGHAVERAEVLPSGALADDRRFALQDPAGELINGKKFATVHQIRTRYSDDLQSVSLRGPQGEATFALEPDNRLLADWCSEFLNVRCHLIENTESGFPDDCDSPGPTLISTASLAEVCRWFGTFDLEEARRRFRMNLEVAAELPFWEDRFVGEQPPPRRFRIGNTTWQGGGICQRCAVPTRSALAGTVDPGFARQFSQQRQATLPAWSPQQRFDHFYRFGVNTLLDSTVADAHVSIGDVVEPI